MASSGDSTAPPSVLLLPPPEGGEPLDQYTHMSGAELRRLLRQRDAVDQQLQKELQAWQRCFKDVSLIHKKVSYAITCTQITLQRGGDFTQPCFIGERDLIMEERKRRTEEAAQAEARRKAAERKSQDKRLQMIKKLKKL